MEESMIRIRFVPDLAHGTVTPSAPQFGGVQGDRNAAQVSFFVPEALREDSYRFRIEGENGAGGFVTTPPLPLDDEGCVSTLLDEQFTAAGGQLLLRLTVSELQEGNETATIHSFDGRVYFADAAEQNVPSPYTTTLSAMMCRNDEALAEMQELEQAVTAQMEAAALHESGQQSRLTALENRAGGIESDVDALVVRAGIIVGDVDALEVRAGGIESDVDALEVRAGGIESDVDALETQLTALDAVAERKETETTPWKLIQKLVRTGCAARVFAVGDTLIGHHAEYGVLRWKVVGFDHDTAADPTLSHSMTLQLENGLHREDGLYDTKAYDVTSDTGFLTDWETSDIRAWLNSDARGGQWHTSDSGDTAPDYAAQDGFVRGFEGSFLEAIGSVKKQTATASGVTPKTKETNDLFFLPSRPELYGGNPPGGTGAKEGSVYAAYGSGHSDLNASGTSADGNRVKTCGGEETAWLSRSVHPLSSTMSFYVYEDGHMAYLSADSKGAVVPMCCIV